MRCLLLCFAFLQLFATVWNFCHFCLCNFCHFSHFCNFCKSLSPHLETGVLELAYALSFALFCTFATFCIFCNFCNFCLLQLLQLLQIIISKSRDRCPGACICVVFCFVFALLQLFATCATFATFATFAFYNLCNFCDFCHCYNFCKS